MKVVILLVGWWLLFVLCWPVALPALVLLSASLGGVFTFAADRYHPEPAIWAGAGGAVASGTVAWSPKQM